MFHCQYKYSLVQIIGHMEVPLVKDGTDSIMANGRKYMDSEMSSYSNNCKGCEKIKLKDYIEMVRENNGSNYVGYAKDWHFQQ